MLRNYLIIASLLGIGILIGYLLMADTSREQTTVDKGGYPAPLASSPSPAQAIDAELLAAAGKAGA